jgi:AcrR family transcriptional regulator
MMAGQMEKKRQPEKTREALIKAAWSEFEDAGFDGTNTNRIAARAGFAPQTFYRHFENKTEIFLAVYERWVEEEQEALKDVREASRAAGVIVRHHRRSLNFRRALRALSVSDPAVRRARAQSRKSQIETLKGRFPHLQKTGDADLAARLLLVERLSDACAEGELADLGLSAAAAEKQLADLLRWAFTGPR